MRECQFIEECKNNPAIKQFVENRLKFYRKIKSIGNLKIRTLSLVEELTI